MSYWGTGWITCPRCQRTYWPPKETHICPQIAMKFSTSAVIGATNQFGTIEKVFPFKSKTNPDHNYECILYTNKTTSCNCRGWTMARNGKRSCVHTQMVEGQLDIGGSTAKAVAAIAVPVSVKPALIQTGRRFSFD